MLGLLCLMPFLQYFSYIVAVKFIGGGNRRKPWTCRKSLTNLSYDIAWARFERTTLVVIGKNKLFSCVYVFVTNWFSLYIWQWRLWCKMSQSFFSSLYFVWYVWTQIAKYTIVEDIKQNSWTARFNTCIFGERERERERGQL